MKDLTSMKFGRLTVISRNGSDKHYKSMWLCECECGVRKTVVGDSLKKGRTRSCGCLDKEKHITHPNRKLHGMCGTRIYRIWKQMKTRCNNPNTNDFKAYGSRGIRVCDEWLNNFDNFYNWAMSNGYSDKLTIDRIDVNGNYEPSNCRWATETEQVANKRNTSHIEYNGETHTLTEWEEITGIKRATLYYRIFISNWELEKVFTKGSDYHPST